MLYPKEFKYSKSHEWVQFIDETTARVGLTDFAQDALGELVFVKLPESGDNFGAGDCFADVESVKAVSEVYSPVSGNIKEANEELMDSPQLINENPYEAWLVVFSDITNQEELLTAEEYQEFCEKGE